MERSGQWLNNILNLVFILASAVLAVLGVLSLIGGPALRFVPYMAGVCGLYYLAASVKTYRDGGRRSFLKGSLLLGLALLCGGFAYVAYRCLL